MSLLGFFEEIIRIIGWWNKASWFTWRRCSTGEEGETHVDWLVICFRVLRMHEWLEFSLGYL